MQEFKEALSTLCGVPANRLLLVDVYKSTVFNFFRNSSSVSEIRQNDSIYAYETPPREKVNAVVKVEEVKVVVAPPVEEPKKETDIRVGGKLDTRDTVGKWLMSTIVEIRIVRPSQAAAALAVPAPSPAPVSQPQPATQSAPITPTAAPSAAAAATTSATTNGSVGVLPTTSSHSSMTLHPSTSATVPVFIPASPPGSPVVNTLPVSPSQVAGKLLGVCSPFIMHSEPLIHPSCLLLCS
jgi:hypothetical protein